MKRKKELFIVLTSLLVIIFSVSVAYFATQILGTGKDVSVTSADLKVVFTSGNGTIANTELEPGWTSGENTFTVKNETSSTYTYNIIIKDLLNTFVTEGFLVYKITSTDGGYNMTEFADVPKSSTATDTILAENISIAKGATHTYKVIFNYNNSDDIDQSEDMDKILTGTLYISQFDDVIVTFDVNGGKVSDTSSLTSVVKYLGTYGELPSVISRTGYIFDGWYTEKEGGTRISETSKVMSLGNQTLYAHWIGMKFIVRFDVNGGNDLNANEKELEIVYGQRYGNLPTPTREGYTFEGWFTSDEDGVQIIPETVCNIIADDHTLFAHWTKK